MSSRKVRVKKLNVKTALPVLREDQIDPSEYEALTSETQIATGVDSSEENEYHLQSILKDAGTSNDQEIPVPPPQESEINYDSLYPKHYHKPSSYIRSSQTVEECISCLYDMTREDDNFLKGYNGKGPSPGPLSEDDFEKIMEVFEDTAAEQTPFAAVDNTVVGYEIMVPSLKQLGETVLQHAKSIFEYWKLRRQEVSNRPLHPALKFETHQETDDTDPYVCFRRREARQTRKTRGRDQKVAETLKRLRKELEDGRQLLILSYEREITKRELLHMDRAVFEERARLKHIKVRVGVKESDEDLINQKPQKRKNTEPISVQRHPNAQPRHLVRSDGRSLEPDLVLLADKLAEKENLLRVDIENKVQNHRRWNLNHIDLTKDPLSPLKEQGAELKFRPAKTQYLMTPPASISSDSMDVDGTPEPVQRDAHHIFQFKAGPDDLEAAQSKAPAFRRRIGRLNRLWIDRRGLATPPRIEVSGYSDRWKYDSDSDDDDESPAYYVDPYETRALKFRSVIPLSSYLSSYPFKPRPPSAEHANAMAVQASRQQSAVPAAVASPAQSQNQPQASQQPSQPTTVAQAQARAS